VTTTITTPPAHCATCDDACAYRPPRLLACHLCYEEAGHEVHPHTECRLATSTPSSTAGKPWRSAQVPVPPPAGRRPWASPGSCPRRSARSGPRSGPTQSGRPRRPPGHGRRRRLGRHDDRRDGSGHGRELARLTSPTGAGQGSEGEGVGDEAHRAAVLLAAKDATDPARSKDTGQRGATTAAAWLAACLARPTPPSHRPHV
jgi:hypothetical protein